ncbi:MAG: hypothetical protein ABSC51_07980 [Gaiellaceae bacterium]|jgi:hypothetical protein
MNDAFPRTRWGSVGLDCADCAYFDGPPKWPDRERVSRCSLHDLSLAVELGPKGYKPGEWFCRDFTDSGHTAELGPMARLFGAAPLPAVSQTALRKLGEIRPELQAGVLYGIAGEREELIEISFADLARDRR